METFTAGLREERVLAIAERFSQWEAWAPIAQRHGNVVVISQLPKERPEEFAARANRRIHRLTGVRWLPSCAVLALNVEVRAYLWWTRTLVARTLLGSLQGIEGNELVLVGHPELSGAGRHELLVFARELGELNPAGARIRVEFRGEPPAAASAASPMEPDQSFRVRERVLHADSDALAEGASEAPSSESGQEPLATSESIA